MEIIDGAKKKIGNNKDNCFHCGSINTETFQYENGLMFQIYCFDCNEYSYF